jgi:hypothetical protein
MHLMFRSAYGSIGREWTYEAMNDLNIPEKLIRLVKMTLCNVQSQTKIWSLLQHVGVFNEEMHCHVFFLI